jgi:hypothetical protein
MCPIVHLIGEAEDTLEGPFPVHLGHHVHEGVNVGEKLDGNYFCPFNLNIPFIIILFFHSFSLFLVPLLYFSPK